MYLLQVVVYSCYYRLWYNFNIVWH